MITTAEEPDISKPLIKDFTAAPFFFPFHKKKSLLVQILVLLLIHRADGINCFLLL